MKNYTKRRNRRRAAKRERARRRAHRLEFGGRCSNCRNLTVVRLIAGSQLCMACAKQLPGHLLRKVFPVVQDPALTKFLRENTVVKSEAVDRPYDEPAKPKSWRDRVGDRVKKILARFRRG